MTNKKLAGLGSVASAALLAVLTACGQGSTPGTAVAGSAVSDGPIAGVVTMVDASSPAQERTVSTTIGGAFVFDAKGTQAPYLLKVAGRDHSGDVTLYGVADGHQPLDVNPITDAAYAAAAGEKTSDQAFRDGQEGDRSRTASGTVDLLNQLKTTLAPLLQLYGIVNPFKDTAQVKLLLADVQFKTSERTLYVTNRATGALIYQAPLRSLASGTFHPENMPAGPCATVTAPTAAGDGAALYAASCQSCHGALASSKVKGATLSDIQEAIQSESKMGGLSSLPTASLTAIAAALSGATGTPGTTCGGTACAYAYGEWSACVSGTQTRDVTSATPAGCTGTPVVSQTCTNPPPPTACTGYAYSAPTPAICPASGQQTRTVTGNTPAGCTGTPAAAPVLTVTCTPPPPPAACTGYTYSAPTPAVCPASGQQSQTVTGYTPAGCTGTPAAAPVPTVTCTPAATACTGYTYSAPTPATCPASGQQTRTVTGNTPAGCTGTPTAAPVLAVTCTPPPPPPPACTGYTYSAPTPAVCPASGQQTRTVTGNTPAGCTGTPTAAPVLTVTCTPAAPACTGYTYSAWGTCSAAGQQTRTVTGNTPAGCTGTPTTAAVLTQSCTPPVTCTLATAVASCSSCHGGSNTYPSGHAGRPKTCASCHTNLQTPTATLNAAGVCTFNYPQGGTHNDGTVNF